jgi:hypothetical protein
MAECLLRGVLGGEDEEKTASTKPGPEAFEAAGHPDKAEATIRTCARGDNAFTRAPRRDFSLVSCR